ncbi:MAG: trigger factor [Gammaproteobacteria bacterium]|nr:trigger factor [Gammaproteobacteria bacterium]
MQVSVENTGGLERRMTVQVPAERIDQEVGSRLQTMSRSVRLDGFRPGKVPLKVVEQKYGRQVRLEVMDQVIHSTLQEALSQESLRPAGEPKIEPNESQPGEALEYTATFEVFPELAGAIDDNFTVMRPMVEVTDAEVDAMLDKLRKQRATWNEVNRDARVDDQVIIDFEGTVGGESFSGNKGEKMPLVLGSNSMIPGFEEQLVGVSAGDEKTLRVSFPKDYPSAEVAGKDAEFGIKVHGIAEMLLPELDDDFARAFGVADRGMAGLREEVTSNMQRELKQLLKGNLKDQVFSGLLEKNPVEVPHSLIENEIVQLRSQQEYQGLDTEALQKTAERRVKLGVLISEIVKHNQIQIDPDRVREAVETIAASYEKPEEVTQWYYGNQEMLAGIQSAVLEEQVVDWMIENGGLKLEEKQTSFDELVDAAKQSKG